MPHTPVLLALDTATSRCSVAIARGAHVAALTREVGQRHTEHLLPMVDALLAAQALELAACDAIAFGAGPGSFTGLRVACGAAQGLAFGIDRPVIQVGNLDAGALEAFHGLPDAARICVALDARMHEIYCAVFERAAAGVRTIVPPALATPASVVALAERHGCDALVGNALAAYGAELARFDGARRADVEGGAAYIARLAAIALAEGRTVEPAGAAPLYVRDRVALTIDERRSGDKLGQGSA